MKEDEILLQKVKGFGILKFVNGELSKEENQPKIEGNSIELILEIIDGKPVWRSV